MNLSGKNGQSGTQLNARSTGLSTVLIVNIVAVLIVGLGILLGQFVYGDWRVRQARDEERDVTEEWQILVRWKLEKETELRDQEMQIAQFEQQIAVLAEREQLLRRVLKIAQEEGSMDQVVDEVDADSIAELQREIDQIVFQFSDLQAQLQQAYADRDVLVNTLSLAEEQLGTDSTERLPDDKTAVIRSEIDRLQEEVRRERFITDEIQSRYEGAVSALLSGDLSGASERINTLRNYLQQDLVASNRAVRRRSQLDRSLLSLLDEAVENRLALRRPQRVEATAEVVKDPDNLVLARSLIADARVLALAGDVDGAITGYRAALGQLPEIAAAVDSLFEQELTAAALKTGAVVTEAGEAASSGDSDRALALYRAATDELPLPVAGIARELIERSANLTLRNYQALLIGVQESADRTARELDQVRASLANQEATLQARNQELENVREFVDAIGSELESAVENLPNVDTAAAITAIESLPHGELLQRLQVAVVSAIKQISDYAADAGAYIDGLSQSLLLRNTELAELSGDLARLDSGLVTLGASAADSDVATIVERAGQYEFDRAWSEGLQTIRDVIGYLDGSGPATYASLLERVTADSLMQSIVIDIQDLAIAGSIRGELPLGQLRLLGVVTSIALNRLSVDVLTSVDARVGMRAIIRRREPDGERDIAEAVVDVVGEDRARLQLRRYLHDEELRPQDLVYLVIE